MTTFCRAFTLTTVWFIIIYQIICYLLLFIRGLYYQDQILFWIFLPLFLIVSTLSMICYWLSIVTDPGSPDQQINIFFQNLEQIKLKSKKQDQLKRKSRMHTHQHNKNQTHNNHQHIQFDQLSIITQVGYCFKCQKIKQSRIHHCKMCEKCIIRMDHHCPFIGNCVGKYNHKYFIQFLFYSTIGSFMVFITILLDFMSQIPVHNHFNMLGKLLLIINAIIGLLLVIPIGSLLYSQIDVLKDNLTTVQSHIKDIRKKNPFNKGSLKQNFQQIFGHSNWFLPTRPFTYEKANQQSYEY